MTPGQFTLDRAVKKSMHTNFENNGK